MKVLIACECSGTVRDAFLRRGHDAWSCDIEPCDKGGPNHIQADVLTVLNQGWDLMIAHPPCTYLTVSGNKWFRLEADRYDNQAKAIMFFHALALAQIERIAIENPVGVMSRAFRKPDQVIQPFQFGHPEMKKTCLWLDGLPLLTATKSAFAKMQSLPKRERERLHYLPPSKTRRKERSKTFAGIAEAMASQWG